MSSLETLLGNKTDSPMAAFSVAIEDHWTRRHSFVTTIETAFAAFIHFSKYSPAKGNSRSLLDNYKSVNFVLKS